MLSRARLLLLVAGIAASALVIAVVVEQTRPRAQPPAAGLPSPAPGSVALGPPLFDAWMKFETDATQRARLTPYYEDAILAHQVFQFPPGGLPPTQARELLLDDDHLLLSSGRRLWNKELTNAPGLTGKFCYLHSGWCLPRLFETQFFIDGQPALIYDDQFSIQRTASHTRVTYQFGAVKIDEYKYITWDDQAACTYRITSADGKAHTVGMEVWSQYILLPNADRSVRYPLLGRGVFQQIPLFVYLDAPGFSPLEGGGVHLRRTLDIQPGATATQAQVAVSFDTQARPAAAPPLPESLFEQHQREYNRWFADNVPYFDAADFGFKKMWYYRWWVVRFNMAEADTPDGKGYRFYEGKMGFDNAITFAIPVQLKELTYLRDPRFALQQTQNTYANVSPVGAVVDPSGSPYWREMYSHWIAAAVAEMHRVHPIPADALRALLPAMARDVRAWTTTFDPDGNGIPQRAIPRITGYDLDILSYWFFSGNKLDWTDQLTDLERVDFASFVYANATAVAELASSVNDAALITEFSALAARIRSATLASLWDDETHFFYPQRVGDHARAQVRELHGFFPFTTQLAPDEPRYTQALQKLTDPEEFWARFPPVIVSLYHYKRWTWDMDGLTRNIAPHPISMGARTALKAIKHYHQSAVTPAHFMELMARYNALVYPGVNPYEPTWRPNVHEYYSKWEPHQSVVHPKPSDISHDFHSMYLSLIVEGVVGLTPRKDERIELQPMATQWPYFALDRLRYRGKDLTIIWDAPDGRVRYPGYPEGFSLFVDGKPAFTRDRLDHVLYDPATGTVTEINGPSPE